jgi:hypothetical protein
MDNNILPSSESLSVGARRWMHFVLKMCFILFLCKDGVIFSSCNNVLIVKIESSLWYEQLNLYYFHKRVVFKRFNF